MFMPPSTGGGPMPPGGGGGPLLGSGGLTDDILPNHYEKGEYTLLVIRKTYSHFRSGAS